MYMIEALRKKDGEGYRDRRFVSEIPRAKDEGIEIVRLSDWNYRSPLRFQSLKRASRACERCRQYDKEKYAVRAFLIGTGYVE